MKNRETLRKILGYIRPYRLLLSLSMLLALLTSLATLYIPILTGEAIDFLADAQNVHFDGILRILLTVSLVAAVAALLTWLMNQLNNRVTFLTVRDLRASAMARLERLPLKAIDGMPVGAMVSRVISDVDAFADGLLLGFTQLFTGVVTILATLVFMLRVDVGIAMVVVMVTPVSMVVAAFIAKRTHDFFALQAETRSDQTAFIDERVLGRRVVTAFSQESASEAQFDRLNERYTAASLRAIFYSSITNPATRFVNALVYAGVALFGAMSAIAGTLTIGQLTVFLSYANAYTKPFNEISGVVAELQNALACAERVFALIETPCEAPDADDAQVVTAPDGQVALCDLTFAYKPGQRLLEHCTLTARPGERVAIVGPTGCGKTTLINLLMRFYEPQSGKITLDGRDIQTITRASLRRSYGMVLQDTWIKRGTVRENIAFGRPDAPQADIEDAARRAHAHGFIARLPKGYDTVIGDDAGLSQGQRQLLAIARVMLTRPSMLILDEATSSIDTRTERKIQDAFAEMMAGRTSFVVAHRLSTIEQADQIVVIRDGQIIEQGTHAALLAQNGFYRMLWDSQWGASTQPLRLG